jgi:zinc/manganese transport system permease protein
VNIKGFDFSILVPAFLAGLLVLATHVPLGRQVLSRGIVFIDLALAQMAGLGVILMDTLGFEPNGWRVQAAAGAAALLGALLLTWTQKRWGEIQEALVGTLFVAAACTGLLLLAHNPHGGEHLQDLLGGQILWISLQDMIPIAVLYAGVLAIWFSFRRRLGDLGFYVLFAVTVTASVQLVGIYLVFASLIVPALAVREIRGKLQLPIGYLVGLIGYVIGLVCSTLFDLPTGPVIVCALVFVMICTWCIVRKVMLPVSAVSEKN